MITNKVSVAIQLRYAVPRDMPQIMALQKSLALGERWSEMDIAHHVQRRNGRYAQVAAGTTTQRFMGLLLFSHVNKRTLCLQHVSVVEEFRRQNVGRQMVQTLTNRVGQSRCCWVVADVDESSLPGLCLLRACDFKAVKVLRNSVQRAVANLDPTGPEVSETEDSYRLVYTDSGDYEPNLVESYQEESEV